MRTEVSFERSMIAACGINCGTCMAFLRVKNRCLGCRVDFDSKRKTCLQCRIRNCEMLTKTKSEFCYECQLFPCMKMVHINKRYRKRYRANLIQNLNTIKTNGMDIFLKSEEIKWTCPNCGATLSVHRNNCLKCSYECKDAF